MSDREDRWNERPGLWRQLADLPAAAWTWLASWVRGRDAPDRFDGLLEGLNRTAEAVWFVTDELRHRATTLIDEGLQLRRLQGSAVPGMYEPLVARWTAEAGALVGTRRRLVDGAWALFLLTALLIAWQFGWKWWTLQPPSTVDLVEALASGLTPGQAASDFKRVFKNGFWVAVAAAAIGSIAVLFLLHVRQPWRVIAAMFLVTIPVAAFGALGYDFAHRSNPVRVAEKDLTIKGRSLGAAKLAHERAAADLEAVKARRTELEAEVRARQLMLDNLKTADRTLPTNRAALEAVQHLSATRLTQLEEDLKLVREQRDEERKNLAALRKARTPLIEQLRELAAETSAAGTSNAPAPGFAGLDRQRTALASQERQLALEIEAVRQRERLLDERQQAKATEIAAGKVDQSLLKELAQLIPDSPAKAKDAELIGGKGRIKALRETLTADLARRKKDLVDLSTAKSARTQLTAAEDAESKARAIMVAAEERIGEHEGKLLEAQTTLFNSWGVGNASASEYGNGGGDSKPVKPRPGGLHDKIAAIQDSVLQVTAVLASFVGATEFQVYMVVFAVVLLFPMLARTVLGSTAGRRLAGLATVLMVVFLVVLA